ncbi:regulator of sigma E protease [Amaricoccus macauensis]|uniref:Zinc metalloprotease n=1 Tax=Amaricoccus macauensis TaxID=57001 RepID=A0A840SJR5_9RHOB|nr:RIP metalloprotease RseP [Amaricoccus macauensis]MBB5220885.1 regulator of sigma E protease [Amaricoccus macauensis]
MDMLAGLPVFGGFLSTVIPFVVVLGIVVFVHEYGHYIVARWCGIRSDVFSIGFGPVIWSRRDKRGTLWQLAALPLGGYVKFVGDADAGSRTDPKALDAMTPAERAASFHGAAVWRRMLTVLAGPVFNFLLTIVIFAGLVTWQGVPTERPTIGTIAELPDTEQTLHPGDVLLTVNGEPVTAFGDMLAIAMKMPEPGPIRVRVERDGGEVDVTAPWPLPPLVQGVEPLSPASEAGLKAGDVILQADGKPLASFEELRQIVLASGGHSIPLEVWRGGVRVILPITPVERDAGTAEGGFERRVMIGVAGASLYMPATETPAPWTALGFGAERMVMVISQSILGLKSILTGAISAENLQGPLGIAQISGETASQGLTDFIGLIAIISTAIGLLNLFPIPVLDGGHFVAFCIEAVRGRPPSPAVMQVAMSIGLGLILLLMVFATYNDIMRMVS